MRALVVEERDGRLATFVSDETPRALDPDDVLVRVEYSSINFKDALVASVGGRVRRAPRLVGGVDAAGVVESSAVATLPAGTSVVVAGDGIGVSRDGGFAEYLYAPARYVTVLPSSLTSFEAMVHGTAGYSAMASVLALEHHGLLPSGRVLVTGATGGVGSVAVALLAARGYAVTASTGSIDATTWLHDLGAREVIGRDEVSDRPDRVLGSERWDGAVDCVGGDTLHQIVRSLRYGAAVAASGLVGGAQIATNVYPFITRAVALLGVDAVEATADERQRVWGALAGLTPSLDLSLLRERVIGLDEVPAALESIRGGHTRGRLVVDPALGAPA